MSGSHQRPHSPLLISKDTVSKFHFLDVFSELPGLGFWDSEFPFPRYFLWTSRAGILRCQHAGLLKTCVLMRESRQKPRRREAWQSPGFWASNKGSCVLREGLGSLARFLLSQNHVFPLAMICLAPKEGGRGRSLNPAYLNVCFLIRVLQMFRLVFQGYHLI